MISADTMLPCEVVHVCVPGSDASHLISIVSWHGSVWSGSARAVWGPVDVLPGRDSPRYTRQCGAGGVGERLPLGKEGPGEAHVVRVMV